MSFSPTRSLAAAAGLAIATASLAACAPSSSAHGLAVVATTTQICDYVTQIAAKSADISLDKTDAAGKSSHVGAQKDGAALTMSLTCLLAPNASAHEHEMTPAQTSALAQADVMAVSGVDLEHFLDDAVVSSGFKGRMVVTSGVLTAADIDNPGTPDPEGAYTIDRGSERVDVAPWPFPPEEAGEEPEFRFDPHVWTSPKGARVQVANLGAGLAAAAPDAASSINAATASYLEDIDALDQWTAEAIETVPEGQRVLFTSHDAFGYFSRDYGIRFIGAALSDFNEQQDATADHIAKA
ncbi:MAG: zinc ABC transporter substrate-binding protein, partial [Schaalia sp.]|nr:zinc ABC transporter substrate-binding protein [Schaalia sp.]